MVFPVLEEQNLKTEMALRSTVKCQQDNNNSGLFNSLRLSDAYMRQ